ncbi:gamma-glutamylcyclotransferase family protein [Natronoglycomyces albus]|uniref:Gamma-glutamylcyclotransferase n=1 Tax=Natronoglycomyces albus TaxID=2811108 RepID=A0A895XJ54_9ACTN|nr:gamma-glutamylcyclotransferase family protein [Natronoglycomyces albus]QSB05007.1 gamma-glutamylcyclotransferase [Natronoglycomyces albus]
MLLYAAYGSNLDPARMQATCPRSPLVGTGWLEGWRLTFAGADLGWESAVATVVESPGERTFVSLYELHQLDKSVLDDLEGCNSGLYRKIQTQAATLEGNRAVWMYVFDGFEDGLPSAWYLQELAQAAEKAGAPSDYVASLLKRPTTPDENG